MTYTLLDFGQRKRKLAIAKKEVSRRKYDLAQKQMGLLLDVVEAYGSVLIAFQEMGLRDQILQLAQKQFVLKQSLYKAGAISKVEVSDAALQTAQSLATLQSVKEQFLQSLLQLSVLTHHAYDDTTVVTPVKYTDAEIRLPDVEKLNEYQAFTLEIEKKKTALEVLDRARWAPSISLYSNYFLYGMDRDSLFTGVGNLESRNVAFGLAVAMPVFDGFKSAAERDRARLEIERLQVERDRAVDKIVSDFQRNKILVTSLRDEIESTTKAVLEQKNKQELIDRLTVQQMVDKSVQLQTQIAVLTERISLERAQVRQNIVQQKLLVYMERGAS